MLELTPIKKKENGAVMINTILAGERKKKKEGCDFFFPFQLFDHQRGNDKLHPYIGINL